MVNRIPWKKFLALLPLCIAIVLSIVFLFFLSPEDLVQYIGTQNAYFLMFTVALLGGLTTFNTVPYYSVLLLLASAGLNPLFVGLSSAIGVMCGDSFSYLIGWQGAEVAPARLVHFFNKVRDIIERNPRYFPIMCFLYGSLSPLSNDFITIPAGMAHIPYPRVIAPLAMGNIVFNVSLAYLSVYAYNTVHAFLLG